MTWPEFPTDRAALKTEIEAVQKAGANGLARLAALCVCDVSRWQDRREGYPGPEGLRPVQYLDYMLQSQHKAFQAGKSPFRHSGSGVGFSHPKPARPQQAERRFSDAEARRIVADAVRNAPPETVDERARHYRVIREIIRLWQTGITLAELEPLLRLMRAPANPDRVEMLIRIGETDRAMAILAKQDGLCRENFDAARSLIAVGEAGAAQALLDRLWSEGGWLGRLLNSRGQQRYYKNFAEGYAYLGDARRAREIAGKRRDINHFEIESIIALSRFYETGQADISPLVRLFKDAGRGKTGKILAHRQIEYLEVFLALQQFDAAWMALDAIRQTLFELPTFGKFEYRLRDTCGMLGPFVPEHEDRILDFIQDILVTTATDLWTTDTWRMAHAVTGGAWLIFCLSPQEEVNNLLEFAEQWSQETSED